MNKQDYIQAVVDGKVPVVGLESTALAQLKAAGAEIEKAESKIREIDHGIEQLTAERERARTLTMTKRGAAGGLADLLWVAEEARRASAAQHANGTAKTASGEAAPTA